MTRTCSTCRTEKSLDEFHRDPSKPLGRSYGCKPCVTARRKAYYADPVNRERRNAPRRGVYRDPDKAWPLNLKWFYNITPDDYFAMLAQQGGVCAICKQPETATFKGKVKRYAVDHDHSCCPGKRSCGECVRGLLCCNCNQTIGHAQDDPDRLEAAAAYLRRQPSLPRP